MEEFSTPRESLVPRLTNLLTVGVVLGAMAWSGAHRPIEERREAALGQPSATIPALPVVHDEVAPAKLAPLLLLQTPQIAPAAIPVVAPLGVTQVNWLPTTPVESSSGLLTIGFVAASRH